VGVASYLMSLLQGENTEAIASLFEVTGFWDAVQADPFSRNEWSQALERAPTIKEDYYTVLSSPESIPEARRLLAEDPRLARCFRD
jgi:glycerol-1-phosphate dehydrogenase [NAD(P)+]